MGEAIRILILEDAPTDAALEEFELQEAGLVFTSKRVMTEKDYIRELQYFSPHLILSDYDLPQYNGALALADAKRECPDTPFILVTGAVGEDRAIEILTQGAKDYVLKSRLNRLVPAVQRALQEAQAHKARRKAEEDLREAHRALENQVEERTAELRAEIAFRKRTEESLRRSEENLRLALDASGQGIWDWNLTAGELIWSDKCKALFGLRADASVSYDVFLQLVHPEDRERISQAASQALERREDYDVEMRVLWPDGTLRWVASKGRGLYNEENKPLRMIGVTHDITERRQLENDLTNARKLEAVGTLAGGIAHDFNNLLAVIQGHIDLVRMGVSPESRASDGLKAVEEVIRQATELTNRLITFARGGQHIKKLCDVREMIKDTVNRMVEGLPLEVTSCLDDDLRPVEVDEGQLRQVIRNLVVNAIEAMTAGGGLRIGAKNVKVSGLDLLPVPEGDYIRICIADSGIGISEEDLTHIFDPYFSTKQMGAQKGMGLGLSVCYSIVSRHQGCITVDSQKGQGSSFYVYLPLLIREVPAQSLTRKENQGKSESSRRVLVMDDEAMVREVTRDLLAASGYDAETTADGLDAVNIYIRAKEAGNPFAAVILDLSVKSGLGGLPTLKKLLEIDPQVKGIISSGYSDHPVIHNFRQYGFIGAVIKPFTREKLISIIEELTGDAR